MHCTSGLPASSRKSRLAPHVERVLPVIDEAAAPAGLSLSDLDAIAVANTPGLAGSLLVGLSAAKALCLALGKPLVAVNHLHAHIYACRIASGQNVFPCVGLIVSGGHSNLYRCEAPYDFHYLGGTIDDAAGEAFDKVASMLGLPYPGGPAVSRAAESGPPTAYRFPRSFLGDDSRLDFSFSGLKTAVRYTIAGPGKPATSRPDLAAPTSRRYRGQFSRGRGRLPGREIAPGAPADRYAATLRRRWSGRQSTLSSEACRRNPGSRD